MPEACLENGKLVGDKVPVNLCLTAVPCDKNIWEMLSPKLSTGTAILGQDETRVCHSVQGTGLPAVCERERYHLSHKNSLGLWGQAIVTSPSTTQGGHCHPSLYLLHPPFLSLEIMIGRTAIAVEPSVSHIGSSPAARSRPSLPSCLPTASSYVKSHGYEGEPGMQPPRALNSSFRMPLESLLSSCPSVCLSLAPSFFSRSFKPPCDVFSLTGYRVDSKCSKLLCPSKFLC